MLANVIDKFSELEKGKKLHYVKTYRELLTTLGDKDGYFLCVLIDRLKFHEQTKSLKKGAWFYLTIEDAEYYSGLGKTAQATRIKSLTKLKLIEVDNKNGNKRYFKLNVQLILDIIKSVNVQNAFKQAKKKKNHKKAAHLPKGCHMDNLEGLFQEEIQTAQNGESRQPEMGQLESSKWDNPLYKTKKIKLNKRLIKKPSKTEVRSFPELEPFKQLRGKLPEKVIGKIESTICNYTFQNDKERYKQAKDYMFAFIRVYKDYKQKMSEEGFQKLFDLFLTFKGKVKNVMSFLKDKADIMLGEKESQFGITFSRPDFKKAPLDPKQREEYMRLFNQFDIKFPWNHYNELFNQSLNAEQLEQKKQEWLNLWKSINQTA